MYGRQIASLWIKFLVQQLISPKTRLQIANIGLVATFFKLVLKEVEKLLVCLSILTKIVFELVDEFGII